MNPVNTMGWMDFLSGDISVQESSQCAEDTLGRDDTLQFFPLCGALPRLLQLHSANNLKWKQAAFLPLLKCAMTRFFKIPLFL